MEFKFNTVQLGLIQKIAKVEIESLLELQKWPNELQKRVDETKAKGFDNITISDYYEDIAESWEIWESILEYPQNFLKQRFVHNYKHLQYIMERDYTPEPEEVHDYIELLDMLSLVQLNIKNNNT
jgi:hypothetical protein